jgi:hypothetical protein
VQALGIDIMLSRYHLILPSAYIPHLSSSSSVTRILALSRELVAAPGFSRSFVCGNGIIQTIWIVVMLCQDNSHRIEAVDILKSMVPRIEGIWHSSLVASIGEQLLLDIEAGKSRLEIAAAIQTRMKVRCMRPPEHY